MTDATDIVRNYRLALRDLWNSYFYADPAYRGERLLADFEGLKPMLFETMVESRLEYLRPSRVRTFDDDFRLVPRMNSSRLQVFAGSESLPSGGIVFAGNDEDSTLLPIDFWDEELNGWRDFRFWLVLIERLPKHPEHEGKKAIIEFEDANVILIRERLE